ncbi:hypothetical protein, partial [Erythrobacter donghaensis]
MATRADRLVHETADPQAPTRTAPRADLPPRSLPRAQDGGGGGGMAGGGDSGNGGSGGSGGSGMG